MNDFLRNITSPSWWLGVVILSFIINLASAYSKPLIDHIIATFSKRARRKLEQSKSDLARRLQELEATPDGIVLLSLQELKFILLAVLCSSLGILLLICVFLPTTNPLPTSDPKKGLLLFIPLLLIMVFFFIREAKNKGDLLKLANEKRREYDRNEA